MSTTGLLAMVSLLLQSNQYRFWVVAYVV